MEVGRLDFAEDGVVVFGDEGHGEPPLLYVVDVFDDGGDGGDSAEDGEYWDHGCSPLLGGVFCPGVSRTYSYVQNPCQKENAIFRQKSQGGELGLYALMNAYTKSYTEIHFRMRCKTKKAPPKRSLSYSAKTQMGFVVYRGVLSALRQAQGPCLYASVRDFIR